MSPDTPHDPRYLQGIEYFNECEFFEAHDTWEALWTEYHGPSRDYYKGLIQAAVCLHHYVKGNIRRFWTNSRYAVRKSLHPKRSFPRLK